MSRGGFSSCMKIMCSVGMEDMMDSPDADVADRHGNKLKRSRRQIIDS